MSFGVCPSTMEIRADGAPLDTIRCSMMTGHRGWHCLLSDDDGRVLIAWENADDPGAKPPPEVDEAIMSRLLP